MRHLIRKILVIIFYYVSAIFGVQAITQQMTKQATNPKEKEGKRK
jgi:hypothetical protein